MKRPKLPRHPLAPGLYILKDKKALSVGDVVRWGEWWEANEKERIVKQTLFKNADPWKRQDMKRERQKEKWRTENYTNYQPMNLVDLRFHVSQILVSTVFLGIDHSWGGKPLIFETMVFKGPLDDAMNRYTEWDEAMAGHLDMVERVRHALATGDTGEDVLDDEIAALGSATGK